jgi:hypothetical protein
VVKINHLDRDADAERHFGRAIAMNRAASATLPLAHTLCDYAAWSSRAGPTAASRGALDEAKLLIEASKLSDLGKRHAYLNRASPP